jgi:spoIIIJ-associated protein
MMREVEIKAPTVAQAIEQALQRLNASRAEVEVDVLKEDNPEIDEQAVVRVCLKEGSGSSKFETATEEIKAIDVACSVIREFLEKLGLLYDEQTGEEAIICQENGLPGGVILNVSGEDLGLLIGRRGQTLTSLQYLVRLIVQQHTGSYVPIIIDVNGYRQRRLDALKSLALKVARRVKERKMAQSLDAMPAFDRRVIHLTLADNPDVTTQSVGTGEDRKVVILLREKGI